MSADPLVYDPKQFSDSTTKFAITCGPKNEHHWDGERFAQTPELSPPTRKMPQPSM